MAATVPIAMEMPSRTSVVIDPLTLDTTVTISWVAPNAIEAGGSPVTGFKIRRN